MIKVVDNQEGRYSLHISSSSGNPLFESNSFGSREEAEECLQKLKGAAIFERKTNTDGKFIINLKTANGMIIGQSKPYSSEAGMENGIKNLKRGLQIP